MVTSNQLLTKLNDIEAEIEELRLLVVSNIKPKHFVSLRGMAKLLVPENELEKSIKKAKSSLSKRSEDVCS